MSTAWQSLLNKILDFFCAYIQVVSLYTLTCSFCQEHFACDNRHYMLYRPNNNNSYQREVTPDICGMKHSIFLDHVTSNNIKYA